MVAVGVTGEKWEQKRLEPDVQTPLHAFLTELDQTLFGRRSAVRPPQTTRILPAIVLMPNNHNLEAGICTYCGKKVVHFGASEWS